MRTIYKKVERQARGQYVTVSQLENNDVRFIACAGGLAPPTLIEMQRSDIQALVIDLQSYLDRTKQM